MSPDDDLTTATDRLLAGFDFARATEAADRVHRLEVEGLLTGFLEVVDSLDACAAWMATTAAGSQWAATVERIRRQALRVLQTNGVEPLQLMGTPVDLTHSEVVEVRTDDHVPHDTVLEEIVRAYTLRGRLLRRARVVISREPLDAAPTGSEENAKGDRQ